MKEYINNIVVPYIQRKRKELKLASNYPALAIFDEFKGQLIPGIFSLIDANRIFVVKVPPNCTDRLQTMDLSVNKAVKEFLGKKFQQWYSGEVESLYRKNGKFKTTFHWQKWISCCRNH